MEARYGLELHGHHFEVAFILYSSLWHTVFSPILCIELIRVLGNYGQSPNLGHLSGVELVPGVSLFPHLLIPLDSTCPFVQVVDGTSVASDKFVVDEDLVSIFCKIKWKGSMIA